MILKRVAYTKEGTWGVWIDKIPFAVSLELPWLKNIPMRSCIPRGKYKVKRIQVGDQTFFKLQNVPGRTGIDIHTGNTTDDIKGCILIGEQYGELNGTPAVLSSGFGFDELILKTVNLDEFDLTILGNPLQEMEAIVEKRIYDRKIKKNILPDLIDLPDYKKDKLKKDNQTKEVRDVFEAFFRGVKEAREKVEGQTPLWKRILGKVLRVTEYILAIWAGISVKKL